MCPLGKARSIIVVTPLCNVGLLASLMAVISYYTTNNKKRSVSFTNGAFLVRKIPYYFWGLIWLPWSGIIQSNYRALNLSLWMKWVPDWAGTGILQVCLVWLQLCLNSSTGGWVRQCPTELTRHFGADTDLFDWQSTFPLTSPFKSTSMCIKTIDCFV